jgi:hypothetical protein
VKSERLKPQELPRQTAHGIKLKATVIGGEEWQKSWLISLAAAGGGYSVHKPSKTTSVLNRVCGSIKRGRAGMCQKRGFLEQASRWWLALLHLH